MTNTDTPTTTTDAPPPVKPGARTSEFYLALAAKLLGGAYATGLIGDGTLAARIAGLATVVLAYFGYTVSRTVVKSAGALALALAIGGASMTTACAGARPLATTGVGVFIDCEADHLRAGVAELVPLATQAVLAAISGDGRHIDTTAIRSAAHELKSDLGRCALATAIAILAAPPPARASSTASSALAAAGPVDRGELLAAFELARADLGGASYRTRAGVL